MHDDRDLVKSVGKKASFNKPEFNSLLSVKQRLESKTRKGLQVGTLISQSTLAVTRLIEYFPDAESVDDLVSQIEHMIFISQIESVVDAQQFTSRKAG